MTDSDQNFREFMSSTCEKAKGLLDQVHIGDDTKKILRDFLQVTQNFEQLLSSNVGANADQRLSKKRLEQAKLEHRQIEKQLNDIKTRFLAIIEDVKTIGSEVSGLQKAIAAKELTNCEISAQKIKTANQHIAEIIAQSRK